MTEFDGMRWCFRAFALSTCIITIPVAFYNLPIYIIINIYILVLYIVGETAMEIKPKAKRRRKKRRSNKPTPANAAG